MLFGISIVFYALGSVQYVLIFSVATILTIFIGRAINKYKGKVRTVLLFAGIVMNAGLLIYYKYTDFAIATWGSITSTEVELKGLILPMGNSFFTFKAISYLVDIYIKMSLCWMINQSMMHYTYLFSHRFNLAH